MNSSYDTDNHLKEAAKSHNFENEEQKDAWMESIKKFGEYFDENYDESGEEKDYIDKLIDEYHFKTLWDTEEIWYYDKDRGIFIPNAEPTIKARIEHDYKDQVKNKDVNEYLGKIQRRTYTKRHSFNPDISWIATKNCMVNLKTGETQAFDPEFMNITQIPIEYNPNIYPSPCQDFFNWVENGVCNNHCPQILKFLNEIMSPQDVELVLDFLAYCLWREYKFNAWMLFNGAGQNGKSTLLNLIERLFGTKNVSGESLERLLTERFAPANLYQKMVNLDADLSGDILLRHTGKLKKLTGNDEYPAEFKFKKPFTFKNYAKLIFSCNTIPQIHDTTDAMFRRLIIINFTQQFFGEKEDTNLLDTLTTESELFGLFHILVNRLPRVLENGIRKTTSEVMESTFDKYMRGANPIGYFVERKIVMDAKVDTEKLDMYDAYEKFCLENGLALESPQSFSRKMTKDFGFKVERKREQGDYIYFWIGIRPRTVEEQASLDEMGVYSPEVREAAR